MTLLLSLLLLCQGHVQPPPLPSFWCVSPTARVRVTGGESGLNREEGAAVAVLWAQGAWRSVEVDGVTVAGGHRVWLPAVGR